jgi:hypothetical protein
LRLPFARERRSRASWRISRNRCVFSADALGWSQPEHIATPPPPSQAQVEHVVNKAAQRIVRFLAKRGLIALATAPGDDEVTVSSLPPPPLA